MYRVLGSVLPALLVVMLASAPARSETIDLSPRTESRDTVRVSVEFHASGNATVRVEEVADSSGGEQQLPISVAAKLRYDERRLVDGVGKAGNALAVRYYDQAEASIKVDDVEVAPRLAELRRLIVVEQSDSRPTLYAPSGPMPREELDLIDVVGNTAVLDQLVPAKAVAKSDHWAVRGAVMAALLAIDSVSSCEVESVLDEYNSNFAKIRLAGVVNGMSDDTPTQQEVRAVYLFDRTLRRVTRLNIAVHETRSIGSATPGLDAVAKLQVRLETVDSSPQLSDAVIAGIAPPGGSDRSRSGLRGDSQFLLYESSPLGFRAIHDRHWYVTSEDRESVTLRRVEDGDLLAQCTVTALPPKSASRQTSLEQFQKDIVFSLGKNFGELVSSRQWVSARGHYCYEVVVRGMVQEFPIEWHYYLIAQESGHRVSLAVTIEGSAVEQLGRADRELVEAIELFPPKRVSVQAPIGATETTVK